MKLRLSKPYLSIDNLNDIELPDFVVLTGKNGSGKSQLLRAIKSGDVQTNLPPDHRILHYTIDSFRIDREHPASLNEMSSFAHSMWDFFYNDQPRAVQKNLVNIERKYSGELAEVFQFCESTKKSIYRCGSALPEYLKPKESVLAQYCDESERFLRSLENQGQEVAASLLRLFRSSYLPIAQLTEYDFKKLVKPAQTDGDNVVESFTRVFLDYFRKHEENEYRIFQNTQKGRTLEVLSPEAFVEIHGEPPWEVANRLLKRFSSVPLQITYPTDESRDARFFARIVHADRNNVTCDVADLSSGERIVLALVATLLRERLDNGKIGLILLDEIDATLHPSIIRDLIDAVRDFQRGFGCNVILVTHSPSTVALAPDGSVHVMNRTGPIRIQEMANDEALQILTDGFAILSKGVALFDFASRAKLTIASEGNNVSYIELLLKLYGINDVKVLPGIESISSQSQLRTLFEFFSRVEPNGKVLFVWDWDAKPIPAQTSDKCIPYRFERNPNNKYCARGIENLLPDEVFDQRFLTEVKKGGRLTSISFDGSMKAEFLQHVRQRNSKDDFRMFEPLLRLVEELRS